MATDRFSDHRILCKHDDGPIQNGQVRRDLRKIAICGVYSIECVPTGQHYIGSSINIYLRWYTHLVELRGGRHHCRKLQKVWAEYGTDLLCFSILEQVEPGLRIATEQKWINACDRLLNGVIVVEDSRGFGWTHGTETKNKISAAARARDLSTFLRGGDHGMARAVEIDGTTYSAVNVAADLLGVKTSTVIARIWRGMGRYLDDPNSRQTLPWGFEEKTGSKHKNARAVYVGDLRFECCKDAAAHFGVHPATFVEWIQKGKARYADGRPAMKIGPKPRKPRATSDIKQHFRMHPVVVDGIRYRGLGIAAQEIGVSTSSIENWLKSGRAVYAPV